jgi:hypothetical protein
MISDFQFGANSVDDDFAVIEEMRTIVRGFRLQIVFKRNRFAQGAFRRPA